MKQLKAILCMLLFAGQVVIGQGREEFNGPFNGWVNVKQRFGARGNGRDDDTKALQAALDSLSCLPTNFNVKEAGYMVIYIPAGVYCISSTLVMKGKIGVSLIGEDPVHTIIKWTGGDKDTILRTDGSAYFKIARLGWDAGGRKEMEGIGIHWKDRWNDGKTRSFASLNIEISDNIFTGAFKYGISGGTFGGGDGTGANDSEITIRRCQFSQCTGAGIEIRGFNALDYWIWDCTFLGCTCGVECSNGGYHVYRSYFSGTLQYDLHNTHGYYNSARGCYSEGSLVFSGDEAVSSNPFKRIFQDNTIVHPGKPSVYYFHLGKIALYGNRFDATTDTANKLTVVTGNGWPAIFEVLSLHNIYPHDSAIRISSHPQRVYAVGDRVGRVSPGATAFLQTMDKRPERKVRHVFEVTRGADGAMIQSILDQAAKLAGQRPVVHFGMGTYYIDRPLVIAAGSDMQLKGEGLLLATIILKKPGTEWKGMPLIRVKGPSTISIADLALGQDGEKGQPVGILFEKCDQPGAQAHLDQIYSHADTSVVLKDLDYLYVQKDNSFFTDGNYVSGGPLVQKGGGSAGLYCYGGQFRDVRVERNGQFLAKDCWWEGEKRIPLDLRGWGRICIDGAMIAPNGSDSLPAVTIGRFKGHIALMNIYLQGALAPAGDNPDLDLLIWNIHFYHKMDPLDFLRKGAAYRGAFLGCNAQCFRKDPLCKDIISIGDELNGVKDLNGFLDKETAFDRSSRPLLLKELSKGVSNIYVARVSFSGSMGSGLVFTGQ